MDRLLRAKLGKVINSGVLKSCRCGRLCDVLERRCIKCGAKNPSFDLREFEDQFSSRVEDTLLAECHSGHPQLMRRILDGYQFRCSLCGVRPIQ